MKQYWLTLHQNTFIWTRGNMGCVYNSDNFKYFRFLFNRALVSIISDLQQMNNLYRVAITEEQLLNTEIQHWIESILSIGSAGIIENDGINPHPVSLKPELKIKDNVGYYEYNHALNKDVGMMNNLHNLVIHFNGSEFGNDLYANQIMYPVTGKHELDGISISHFINSFGNTSFLANVSLIGNIWQYEGYHKLYDILKETDVQISIYCTDKDIIKYGDARAKDKYKGTLFHILVTDYEIFAGELFTLWEDTRIYYDFIVTSQIEFEKAQFLIEKYQLYRATIFPVYTGENLTFFEDSIYIIEDDIQYFNLSKREVFAHQTLNTHFFGTLTVYPDGKVYSDTTRQPIGAIDESLYALVYREMTEGNAWFRIRNQDPCRSCVFQYLCPSPSAYEEVIGKTNLCHVKP